jgi:uncharacterized protein (TIGR03382 family)
MEDAMNSKWMWMAAIVCVAGASAPSIADACGVIIPVEGETASLDAQRVTMAYFPEENRTRVMAQIGYVGDLSNFSWIIPIPSEPTDIQAVDEAGAAIFSDLDVLSAPYFELIDWTCAQNGGAGGASVSAPGVEVLQHGNTGTFEYVVLTGTGGSVVTQWLGENGYALPGGMEEVVHTYIREGSVFMAMKVNIQALELGQLDPAISFDYEGWPGYPLRILQPAAAEEVEIILNVLAPTPAEMPNEVRLGDNDLDWDGQEPQYLDAVRRAGNWVVESRGVLTSRFVETEDGYEELFPPRDLMQEVLGIPAEGDLVLSRFHGIFKPAQLDEDTALNLSETIDGVYSSFQLDVTRDEDCGWDDEIGPSTNDGDPGDPDGKRDTGGCSTSSGNLNSPLLLLFGLWLVRRRKLV